MINLCNTHQIVYDTAKWLYCPVCEDCKEIDRHERENERLRIALETALKHMPSVLIATPVQTHESRSDQGLKMTATSWKTYQ